MHDLPVGKIPPDLLRQIITKAPVSDARVQLGPGIGLDCGVVDFGDRYLVMKTDPITFATDEIGWYAIQIPANDIATTGAKPLWVMVTALFPEEGTTEELVHQVTDQLFAACNEMGISLVNAHTEITYDIHRPIMICAMVGEVSKEKLITPRGAQPGNDILLTKGIPIEGTAILANEFSARLENILSAAELKEAQNYIHVPGIGVSRDAEIAVAAGCVTGMHDPTEGGLASALWEFSEASGFQFEIDSRLIPISALSKKICAQFGINPMNTISSGALLMTTAAADSSKIIAALDAAGIRCAKIGSVTDKPVADVHDQTTGNSIPWPERDEIAGIFS